MVRILKDKRIFTAWLPSVVGLIVINIAVRLLPLDMGEGLTYWRETNYFMGQVIFMPIIILFSIAAIVWIIEKDVWCTKILVLKAIIAMFVHILYWWYYASDQPLTHHTMNFITSFAINWMLIILDVPLNWYISKRIIPTALLTATTIILYLVSTIFM